MNAFSKREENDSGIFEFNTNGFSFTINEITSEKNWNEIEEINVYKKDLMTVDLICMDIIFKNTFITFSEETPDWDILVDKLKEIFNNIQRDWDTEIVSSPFKTNFKTIYKRN